MRFHVAVFSALFLMFLAQQAGADDQSARIDTLIQEPAQAGDLPEVVVKWLVARDLLIPYYGEYGYSGRPRYGNTLIGSFTGENTMDCAVLTIPRGALEDSCSIWVFPSGDTLAPMLIAKHRVFRQELSQWQMSYDKESELEYRWCIRPYGPYSEADLNYMKVDTEGLPEITHQGIFVLQAEKDPYPYYYYDGNRWLQLPLGQ
ncbi:MAG: hypothetical protein A3F83_09440 [Candidatus Glassbacteria bacterium RIFCSPLOWO2_12_FULL_58_11]|uniref:Uncharacterized protein n=1 Tax=Candidatus Glassbacteria bacterium RIFCSPLOWO2_12_FULL_58_11 TaxID=1817867 RepID=A0A1F5YL45_9BACT|nr:MAG: hypothetical protein A3F83_09440 [Candidatus Glassbacteria bacterium RIFCSPLOWO2_12_FULL_58_11]